MLRWILVMKNGCSDLGTKTSKLMGFDMFRFLTWSKICGFYWHLELGAKLATNGFWLETPWWWTNGHDTLGWKVPRCLCMGSHPGRGDTQFEYVRFHVFCLSTLLVKLQSCNMAPRMILHENPRWEPTGYLNMRAKVASSNLVVSKHHAGLPTA